MTVGSNSYSLLAWSAWSPGLTALDDWQSWAQSEESLQQFAATLSAPFVPALARRRCSNLTRANLEVAHACLKDQNLPAPRSVFASRHGESEVTVRTLLELASGNPMSPNDFSLSVHNTSSGLFSILSKNMAASTAVAAGRKSLDAMFYEVFAALNDKSDKPVLAVIADMPCPGEFGPLDENPCYALGMLFSREERGAPVSFERVGLSPSASPPRVAVEDFLRWMLGTESEFRSSESDWTLKRHAAWPELFRPIEGVEKHAS